MGSSDSLILESRLARTIHGSCVPQAFLEQISSSDLTDGVADQAGAVEAYVAIIIWWLVACRAFTATATPGIRLAGLSLRFGKDFRTNTAAGRWRIRATASTSRAGRNAALDVIITWAWIRLDSQPFCIKVRWRTQRSTYCFGARMELPSRAAIVGFASTVPRSAVCIALDLNAALNVVGISGTQILWIGNALACFLLLRRSSEGMHKEKERTLRRVLARA